MNKSSRSVIVMVSLLVIVAAGGLFAQVQNNKLSGGLELSIPTGDFGDVAGTGFGVSGQYLYAFRKDITITGSAGYLMWGGKDFGYYSYNYSDIPIKGGLRYYINPGFYVMGELGLHIYMFSFEYEDPITHIKVSDSDSDTEFGFAPGVGYEHRINEKMTFDLSIRYEIGDLDYLAIRGGLNFDMK